TGVSAESGSWNTMLMERPRSLDIWRSLRRMRFDDSDARRAANVARKTRSVVVGDGGAFGA
ncbi:hypothetical protein, partial [Nocardia sp. NPDC049707]|uniref:hypothetical protein n=1 Tax=Nocardia sp. NPDC049707 TaxID=3154735 RepID=UPI00342325AC